VIKNKFPLKCIISASLLAAASSHGAEIDIGNPEWKVRWDNTIKYSNLYRLQNPNSEYLGANTASPTGGPVGGSGGTGAGDGNRNFDRGFASHRFDILSEFDAVYKNKMGARLSVDGWYDPVYFNRNDNDTGFTHNVTVPANEFSDGVQETMGRNLRLLDMYAFFKGDIGSMPFRVNIGQHTTIYGESLIGGNNAIAAANGPVDIIKAATVPGAKVKEFLLPVPQLSFSLQPTEKLKVGAYYQTSWRESQFFAPGSFLSPNDVFGKNAQALFSTPGGGLFNRAADIDARDSGQWGTEIKYRPESVDVELGAYAVNWHDKVASALYFDPAVTNSYRRVFAEDIRAYGVSASGVIAKHSVSIESSYRDNMPIVGGNGFVNVVVPNNAGLFDNHNNPAYAVGNTFHTTLVAINTIQPNFLMDGGSYVVQWDYHKLVDVDKNPNARDRGMDSHANQVTFIFQPEYYNVIDGVDIQLPIVLGYTTGKSPIYAGWVDGGGTLDVGVKGTYRTVWEFGLNYRNYYGPEGQSIGSFPLGNGSQNQTMTDRDFLSFTFSRTF
jgi:hypothetical protein